MKDMSLRLNERWLMKRIKKAGPMESPLEGIPEEMAQEPNEFVDDIEERPHPNDYGMGQGKANYINPEDYGMGQGKARDATIGESFPIAHPSIQSQIPLAHSSIQSQFPIAHSSIANSAPLAYPSIQSQVPMLNQSNSSPNMPVKAPIGPQAAKPGLKPPTPTGLQQMATGAKAIGSNIMNAIKPPTSPTSISKPSGGSSIAK